MLITLTRDPFKIGPPLTIGVSDDRSDDVISAMTLEGWHVLSKVYGPASPVVDTLQVALLEVSTLPAGTPIRAAVELVASAAILGAPDLGVSPPDSRTISLARARVFTRSPQPSHVVR